MAEAFTKAERKLVLEAVASGAWMVTWGRDPGFYIRPDGSNELLEQRAELVARHGARLAALWFRNLEAIRDDYAQKDRAHASWLRGPDGQRIYAGVWESDAVRFEAFALEHERAARRYGALAAKVERLGLPA